MRLSESKIKSSILHRDQFVRDVAVAFFSNAFSPDPTVMPVAIQALETYGWKEAFADIVTLENLTQSDETVSWLIDQLRRAGDSREHTSLAFAAEASWILAEANAGTLKRRRTDILSLRLLDPAARSTIVERTRLLSALPAASWQELVSFCYRVTDQQTITDAELSHISHVIEALARHPSEFRDRVHATLAEKVDIDGDLGRAYLDLFVTRTAGLMRLESTIPFLVERLASEIDWLCEESSTALIRVGTDAVVKALWNACATASEQLRDSVSWGLCGIHSDLAAEACLHLFQAEQDAAVKVNFGHALLAQFEIDGIGPVRQYVLNGAPNDELTGLRDDFLAVCSLMEAEFPELAAWRQELQQHLQFRSQWQTPEFPVTDTWSEHLQETSPPQRSQPAQRPAKFPVPGQRVGRNAPCPCGSGKKYKDCCRSMRVGR